MRACLRVSGQEDARAADMLLRERGYEFVGPDPAGSTGADLLVVDEWTPEDDPWVRAARGAGTSVTVLAELLLERAPGTVVGVTGTAGKTSTCRSLAHLLRACGVPACISDTARSGNAWPDHSLAGRIPAGAVVVAELTSTHLCHMDAVRADVGVVTTVRPDHIELHGTLERYVAAKRRLVEAVPEGAPLVLPVDDPATLDALGIDHAPSWGFGAEVVGHTALGAFLAPSGEVVLRSPHAEQLAECAARGTAMRAVLAAAAAALSLGGEPAALATALAHVPSAPHRMCVRQLEGGLTLIDNTMAATPLKVMAGLADAPAGPVVLVMGGTRISGGIPVHDSPEERRAMRQALHAARERAASIVAFGPAAADIAEVIPTDAVAPDIGGALTVALEAAEGGATVMVAPMFPMTPAEREFVADYGRPR